MLTGLSLPALLEELAAPREVPGAGSALAVTLAECCFGAGNLGADVNVQTALLPTVLLFSESAHRALVTIEPGRERLVLEAAKRHGVPTSLLGRVVAGELTVRVNGEPALRVGLDEMRNTFERAFVTLMEESA